MEGWAWAEETPAWNKKRQQQRFIKILDPRIQREVWVEWNGNLKKPQIHKSVTNDRGGVWMSWIDWDISGSEEQASEIPGVQTKNGSHSANYIPIEEYVEATK